MRLQAEQIQLDLDAAREQYIRALTAVQQNAVRGVELCQKEPCSQSIKNILLDTAQLCGTTVQDLARQHSRSPSARANPTTNVLLRGKLLEAIEDIERLTQEKQQLVDISNELRGEIAKAQLHSTPKAQRASASTNMTVPARPVPGTHAVAAPFSAAPVRAPGFGGMGGGKAQEHRGGAAAAAAAAAGSSAGAGHVVAGDATATPAALAPAGTAATPALSAAALRARHTSLSSDLMRQSLGSSIDSEALQSVFKLLQNVDISDMDASVSFNGMSSMGAGAGGGGGGGAGLRMSLSDSLHMAQRGALGSGLGSGLPGPVGSAAATGAGLEASGARVHFSARDSVQGATGRATDGQLQAAEKLKHPQAQKPTIRNYAHR